MAHIVCFSMSWYYRGIMEKSMESTGVIGIVGFGVGS